MKPEDAVADLEALAKKGEDPPREGPYRIRVDRTHIVVEQARLTGREILTLAGKAPPERFRLDMKKRGGDTVKVELTDVVDLSAPGIERFMTIPLDQTEGAAANSWSPRREFDLPEEDTECLDARELRWETIARGGAKWLLLHDFPIPPGYNVTSATVAILITPSYPMAALDMAYFRPALALDSRRPLRQVQVTQTIDGQTFQRWSRHYTAENPWQAGVHSVITHIAVVEEWLRREVPASV